MKCGTRMHDFHIVSIIECPTVDSEAPQLCCGIEPLYISEISKTMAKNMSTPNTSELSHLISNRTMKVADVFFSPNVYFRDSTLT